MDSLFEKKLITTKDAAEISGYHSDYLARLARSGKISARRVGHSWLIDQESLARFVEEQNYHKIDYALALSRAREKEYLLHQDAKRDVAYQVSPAVSPTITPQKSIGHWVSERNIDKSSPYSQVFAFAIAFLVVTSGALAAKAMSSSEFGNTAAAIAHDFGTGFTATFGDIPSRIASRISAVKGEVSSRTALRTAPESANIVPTILAKLDFSSVRMVLPENTSGRSLSTAIFAEGVPTVDVASMQTALSITSDEILSSLFATYTILTTPSLVANTLAQAYFATGAYAYLAITNSFSTYHSLIEQSGIKTLALAVATRDLLVTTPHLVRDMNLAIGTAVIEATHAAIRTDVMLAYEISTAGPKTAETTVAFVGRVGDSLANITARTAIETPAHVARALRNVGEVGYTNTVNATAFLNDAKSFIAHTPIAIRDVYSGTVAQVPQIAAMLAPLETMTRGVLTDLWPTSLTGLAAIQPAFSTGERAALFTYKTINDLFNSANQTLVALFAPPPTIVIPSGIPKPRVSTTATTTPLRTTTYNLQPTTSFPTYTTVVQGVTESLLNISLASLRSDILATVATQIQPVAAQGVTNASTIQYVNMIQDLSNLIVRNGDFRGGTFSNGTSVSATTGTFTNLTGGATTLGATTISGTLTVNGVPITGSGGSGNVATSSAETIGNLPYWTSTAGTPAALGSAANLNWNNATNLLSITGNASTTQLTTTGSTYLATLGGNVGIGTTSPYRSLSVNGSAVFTGGDVLASTITATSSITANSLSLTTALPISSGGTGLSSITGNRLIYTNSDGTAFAQVATSSLNIGGNAATVTNGVYTDTFNGLFDNRLSASSSIAGITTLGNLSITKSQVSDFGTYESPLTFTYPLSRAVNAISLAFGTTTSNTWAGTQSFSTASTTNLIVSSAGGSGTRCLQVAADGTISATAGACGVAGAGIQNIGPAGQLQSGTTQTLATSTPDTNLGMTIVGSTDTQTFTPYWIGQLSIARGGTGLSSITGNRLIYTNSDGTAFAQVATSSLNIGGNAATVTTNANLSGVVTSSGNTTSFGSQTAGVLGNSATGNTAPMATSTLYGVAPAGGYVLGWDNAASGIRWIATSTGGGVTSLAATYPLLTTGATGAITISTALATTSANTWAGTQSFSTASTTNLIVSSAGGSGTRCLQVAADGTISATAGACGVAGAGIQNLGPAGQLQSGTTQTLATSTPDTNLGMTIVGSSDIQTFTPYWIGQLSIARGGTGLSSITGNRLLYSNSAGTALVEVATSSLNIGGNAATATVLETARTINGISFNGSANIIVASTTLLGDTNTWTNTQTMNISGSATTAASSTLLANTNTWSGTNNFSTLPILGTLAGFIAGNSGSLYQVSTSSIFGFTPASNATTITTTYPLQGGGDLTTNRTFSLAFGTTTSNTWAGTQTFTNAPTLATFSGLVGANTGATYAVSTSTLNIGGTASNVTGTVAIANGGTGLSSITGNRLIYTNSDGTAFAQVATSSLNIGGNAATVTTNANLTGVVTSVGNTTSYAATAGANTILANATGGVAAPTFVSTSTLNIGGNAGTATTLQTARTINGISFNGSANIVVASTTLLADVNTWTNTQTMNISGSATTAASSTLLANTNTWSGTNNFSTLPTLGTLAGFIAGNSGSLYQVSTSSIFGFTPASNATTITTTYPLQGGGDLTTNRTFSLAFGTTTSNTWAGTQTFTNAPTLATFSGLVGANTGATYAVSTSTMNIGGNAGTVTNGVYTTTFNNLFDNRLSASSSIAGITTLGNLSITKSQVSDFGTYESPLTFTYPLSRAVNAISLAFGTTTSNTWAGTQTFTNAPVLASFSGLVGANTGTTYAVSTSTLNIGGNAGTATTLQTARTINGVSFNGSANIVVASTTLLADVNTWTNTQGMSISGTAANVTGTVLVSTGGTGLTSVADGNLLFGTPGGTAALTTLATSTGGFLTNAYTTGRPSWAATSSLNVALANTTGTLPITRGGTGVTSFTGNALLYSNSDGTALAYAATSTLNIGGNAGTATTLQTARTINGVSFNGSANIIVASTTLLGDTNTWSGNNTFSNAPVLATFSGLVGANTGATYAVSTSTMNIGGNAATVTTNANLTGVVTSVGNTTSYGSQAAGVLGNSATGNTAPMATSTLYGVAPAGGYVLGWDNSASGIRWIATSTGGGVGASTAIGQFPYYAAVGSSVVATSSIFLATSGDIGIGTTSPDARLSVFTANDNAALTTIQNYRVSDTGGSGREAKMSFLGGATTARGMQILVGETTSGIATAGLSSQSINFNLNEMRLTNSLSHPITFYTSGAEKMRLAADGNVGIGTTTPYALLSLSNSATTAVNTPLFTIASTTGGTSTTTLMTVLANGNVGIGTTSPGTILSLGDTGANTINLSTTATSTFGSGINVLTGCFAVNGVCVGGSGSGTINSGTTNRLSYYSGATTLDSSFLALNNSANYLGLGTTTPNFLLQLASSSAPQLALSDGSLTSNHWTFRNAGGNFYLSTSSPSTFATSSLSALTINTNGFFGIGTTTPYAKLSVSGLIAGANFNADNATATSTFAGGLDVNSGGIISDLSTNITSIASLNIGATAFDTDAGVVSWVDMPVTSTSAAGVAQSYTASLNGNPVLTVFGQSDGVGGLQNTRVGIGTTTPYAKLTVWSATTTAENIFQAVNSASSTLLVINNSGNIGIGTTSPWGLLSVNPNGITGPAFVVGSSTATNFIVTNGGNVGIGTTSPATLLSVHGTGYISSSLFVGGAITATSTLTLSALGTPAGSLLAVNASGQLIATSTVAVANLALAKGNFLVGNDAGVAQATSTIFISSTGNVGIGTTGPGAKLDVAGRIWQTSTGQSVFLGEGAGASDDLSNKNNAFVGYYAGNANTTGYDNTALGSQALLVNNVGFQNTAIGARALASNTNSQNVAVGVEALNANTTGNGNAALGYQAMLSNIGGANNSAVGTWALKANISGVDNTALGSFALKANTGSLNLAVGADALSNNTAGENNTALGTGALAFNVSGSNKIGIGYYAGAYSTASNEFYVNAFDQTNTAGDKSNSLMWGLMNPNPANQALTVNAKVGIGTTTSSAKLSVYGPSGDGLRINMASNQNHLVFTESNVDKWVQYTNSGDFRLWNSGLGSNAITVQQSTGNVGIGTTSPYNALTVQSANGITAITAAKTSGKWIEMIAGTSGTGNTFDNTSFYGIFTSATQNNSGPTELMRVTASGNVGIGTSSPGTLLSIGGTGTGINFLDGTAATSTISGNLYVKGTLRATVSYVGDLVFANNFRFTERQPAGASPAGGEALYLQNQFGTTTLSINDNGRVGIGTTTPTYTLHVAGEVGALGFVNTSARNAKKDIEYETASSSEKRLNQLVNLRVATYRYTIEEETSPLRLGFIAEDAATIAPEILSSDGKGVDLYKLATFTLSGVQALASKVGAQEMRVTLLENRIAMLESGAVSIGSGTPTFSTTTLVSAFNSIGAYIGKGFAQFGSLIADRFVAASDANGTSSAGTATILAGDTVAQIDNAYVAPTTKVFVTFNSPLVGNWYVSEKKEGSFRVMLSETQTTDVSFDYFLVQTIGQVATSTPATANLEVSPPSGDVTTASEGTITPPITIVDTTVSTTSTSSVQASSLQVASSTPTIDTTATSTPPPAPTTSTSAPSVQPSATSTPPSTDITAPVVTLNGAAAIQINVGDTFTDPGATALDDVDGDLTASIVVVGAVDTATTGLYTLTYTATDLAGNLGTVSRVITVAASTAGPAPSADTTTTP